MKSARSSFRENFLRSLHKHWPEAFKTDIRLLSKNLNYAFVIRATKTVPESNQSFQIRENRAH